MSEEKKVQNEQVEQILSDELLEEVNGGIGGMRTMFCPICGNVLIPGRACNHGGKKRPR